MRRFLGPAMMVALGLAGCDDAAPDATLTPSPSPTPELTEVGGGPVLESDWSYAVGTDDGEVCTRLEVAGATSTRCGELLPGADAVVGELGYGPDGYDEAHVVEGFIRDEVVTVWLIGAGGQYRIPAVVMSIDEAGIEDGRAFVGFARADVELTHLQAVAVNGDVLQTIELP